MTVIFGTLHDANGQPFAAKSVKCELVGPGFITGTETEIIAAAFTTTDATGRWQFTVEPDTARIADTYYRVTEPGDTQWNIGGVPDTLTPVWFETLLLTSPQPGWTVTAGVQTVQAGTGVTVDASDPHNPVVSSTGGGGGGAVSSVFGRAGVVVAATGDYTAAQVGADVSGAAASALTTAEGYTDTKVAAEVTRANGAYDALGAAAAAQAAAVAASQPLDTDLTAIAALATTTFGRSLLTQADAAALRAAAGLGTAATSDTTAFDAAGAAAAAQAASQPLDSDLTAIAALATTTFGRSFLTLVDAAAGRTLLGLGGAAVLNVGTVTGTVAAGDDTRLTNSRTPTGSASGDLAGTYPSPTVAKVNGTSLAGLATGLLKNTTTTGVPSIAAAADVPTVAAGSTGPLSATDATTTNSRTPNGSAGGDLTGTYPNPTLAAVATPGTTGDASHSLTVTIDAKGRATTVTANAIQIAESQVTSLVTDLAAKVPLATATTKGDLLAATGSAALARVGVGSNNQVLTADSTQATGMKWAAAAGASGTPLRSGRYHFNAVLNGAANNVFATTSGTLYAVPFYVPVTQTFSEIKANIGTAGAAGALLRLMIYGVNASGQPGTLILDAGTVAATSTGDVAITISQSLSAGAVFVCGVTNDSTVKIRAVGSAPKLHSFAFLGANGPVENTVEYLTYTGYSAGSAAPGTATVVGEVFQIGDVPLFALKAA